MTRSSFPFIRNNRSETQYTAPILSTVGTLIFSPQPVELEAIPTMIAEANQVTEFHITCEAIITVIIELLKAEAEQSTKIENNQ